MAVKAFKRCRRKQSGPKIIYHREIYVVVLGKTKKYLSRDNWHPGWNRVHHLLSTVRRSLRWNRVAR